MIPHASFRAPKARLPSLRPVEAMEPYDPCWCRSGKKYKWCHFRREHQPRMNVFQLEAGMLSKLREGYCSYPDRGSDPCSPKITKAHTVQKRGGLAAIEEDGHVLTVKPTMIRMIETQGTPEPYRVGVNNASVFPGFCNHHDSGVFRPIEGKTLNLTKDTAFLFAYRAIAYERFAKEAQRRSIELQREMDRGHPFLMQVAVQTHVADFLGGVELGLRDVRRWKDQFDDRLQSGQRGDFHFVAVRFDRVLPIVGCGGFYPEFDLRGRPLQQLGREGVDFDHVTLTVTTFEGETVAVLSWIGDDDGPARALSESFVTMEDAEKANGLTRLLFIHLDNIFIQQSWWEGLDDAQRTVLNGLTRSGTTMQPRTGREMATATTRFVTAGISSIVRS